MSAPDVSPLDRMNYTNGQRLDAGDFRVEQAYHMRVRRWLNRSLYLPGIASGLEVTPHPTDPTKVVVSTGLAIDADGREIILMEPQEITVRGTVTGKAGVVLGNYLVIRYTEALTSVTADGCRVESIPRARGSKSGCGCSSAPDCGCGDTPQADPSLPKAGLSRIRALPVLEFQNTWPTQGSGRIVLGQIDINAQCQVANVLMGMRQYTSESKPPEVRAVSLEGEKDIDHANPKIIYFYVAGGNPSSVTLHLWATRFSTLYYTELGSHSHVITGDTSVFKNDFTHTHTAKNGATKPAGQHTHDYHVDGGETSGGIDVNQDQVVGRINTDASALLPAGSHTHTLDSLDVDPALGPLPHDHDLNATAANTGASDVPARNDTARGYVSGLEVELDGQSITATVLSYLNGANPGAWLALGDGSSSHALTSEAGTGPIDLKKLGVEFAVGRHSLKLSVPSGGGQIHYNLYVE